MKCIYNYCSLKNGAFYDGILEFKEINSLEEAELLRKDLRSVTGENSTILSITIIGKVKELEKSRDNGKN